MTEDRGGAGVERRWHAARLAHRGLRAGLALRAGLYLVGSAVLIVVGILLAQAGIVQQHFPGFVSGQTHTTITAYSGPYLTAAIGVGTLAGLLLVAAITDLWRRRLIGPDLQRSHAGLGQ